MSDAPKLEPVTTKPAKLVGPSGRSAWEVAAPYEGQLACWYVHAPGCHVAWEWWQITVVHLRPQEGLRDAAKHYPEATHEFCIAALLPECCPPVPGHVTMLTPLDVILQFDGLTDAMAACLGQDASALVVDGKASPDQDYRTAWLAWLEWWINQAKTRLAAAH